MSAGSVADAMAAQLTAWDHLGPAEEAILLTAAEAVDTLAASVADGAAALPLVNACRYAYDLLRKAAPAVPAGAGGETAAAVMAEWLDD